MFSHQFLNEPGFLSLSREHVHVEDTEHVYYLAPGMDKDRTLVRIIEMETYNRLSLVGAETPGSEPCQGKNPSTSFDRLHHRQ